MMKNQKKGSIASRAVKPFIALAVGVIMVFYGVSQMSTPSNVVGYDPFDAARRFTTGILSLGVGEHLSLQPLE